MRVLAIDSSGLTATVAVVEEERTIAEYTIDYKKTHSQTLLPMIDEVARMIELDLSTIDAIAVAGGPGSFTGLRIGSATAKGLGLALGKPLIHIPTVDGLAYQVYGCEDIICPIMDARRSQVYTGLYTFSTKAGVKEGTRQVDPVFQVMRMQMAVSIDDLIRRLNAYGRPVVFLGDGVPVYKDTIDKYIQVPYSFAPSYMNRQRAAAVGALGIKYLKAGKFESAMEHQPDYLRVSQAERERAEREKKAEIICRTLRVEDAAAIAELERQTFSDAWSEKGVLDTIKLRNTICVAAEKAGRIIGYLLAYDAAGEAEIARIAVDKDVRRQGIGSLLMLELENICEERKIKKLLLDVRESNMDARSFYEEDGFTEDGIRQKFYVDPEEDAVLMSRELGR
ncbi:MAG: tRNA (adenosine(37)-N6)-threonylcarbamoyltransferase complex dimerization subunit type 1 TsaB [Faecalicatena sp.]|uniref:tRNA (adenosine(37)-N6)-threonylcarbamoyltransferase complex dimerization subunit type 1 TsaB n=1 Tax=Faecalicatena sp. TaxID=2005360 RepID=UPI00258D4DCF|nr:tRNA (adenosine(37)-N6)-threonylcarbamoyltransferase complex dimerization subunit type 1 TsaB [Faecalicatena sp.]MCI6467172.1 tRNA (adenosine(37)-N6)-threonylcarbamoyltransferase complex dimerization subunit type 1 TsaB [Faecalicatena sp.]MDY5618956.1 tRNA (adenosine(37)-N6)-threonylcarbamoyltransferase complex dimerization subunit type 1 TsaB [Lachnospiraceae bacterium]